MSRVLIIFRLVIFVWSLLVLNAVLPSQSSHAPSVGPSVSPTVSPQTSSPSDAPTTTRPSANPITTSKPSKAPTKSASTTTPSTNQTTTVPSKTPSKGPSTSRPSRSPKTSKPTTVPSKAPVTPPNVLLLIADDFKPAITSYDAAEVASPGTKNIDALIAQGTSFMNAHTQMALCGPSRASFLTSLRPNTLQIFTIGVANILGNEIAKSQGSPAGEILALPAMFKAAGYLSYGIGKVFHENEYSLMQSPNQWTRPMFTWNTHVRGGGTPYGGVTIVTPYQGSWISAPNVPDTYFPDGQAAEIASLLITDVLVPNNTEHNTPWFLAVGLWKPHLPWYAPQSYYSECGAQENYNGAHNTEVPTNLNARDFEIAKGSGCQEASAYGGPGTLGAGKAPQTTLQAATRAYHASALYMDAQIGVIMDALQSTEAADSTLIVFMGDHGFHLGDHGLYCKHTNYEQATLTPFVIVPPLRQGNAFPRGTVSYAPVELLDLMPTLYDLTGISTSLSLSGYRAWEGVTLRPIMKTPAKGYVKSGGYSQYFRGKGSSKSWGYSVRTTRYRFTDWTVGFQELYDYLTDPWEITSLQTQPTLAPSLRAAYHSGPGDQGNGVEPFDFSYAASMKARPPLTYA